MKFTSEARSLVLQDDDGVWARFADHEFTTDDKDVAARLRKVDGVTEVDPPKAEAKPAAKRSKAKDEDEG